MFWPLTPPQGLRLCVRTKYVLAWCSMLHSLLIWYATWLLSKKNVFTFDPTTGVEGLCKDRICACMLLHSWFHLIWYTTWPYSETVEFWPFDLTARVWGSAGKIFATMIPFNLILNATWPCSEKVEFWPFDTWAAGSSLTGVIVFKLLWSLSKTHLS